jgi:hypothetical protein
MWIFVFIGGLIVPRITIAFLYFFTTWFNGVFDTRAWPILGFLFTPLTLLWYSLVEKMMAGEWTWWQVGIAVIMVLLDLGIIGKNAD